MPGFFLLNLKEGLPDDVWPLSTLAQILEFLPSSAPLPINYLYLSVYTVIISRVSANLQPSVFSLQTRTATTVHERQ